MSDARDPLELLYRAGDGRSTVQPTVRISHRVATGQRATRRWLRERDGGACASIAPDGRGDEADEPHEVTRLVWIARPDRRRQVEHDGDVTVGRGRLWWRSLAHELVRV